MTERRSDHASGFAPASQGTPTVRTGLSPWFSPLKGEGSPAPFFCSVYSRIEQAPDGRHSPLVGARFVEGILGGEDAALLGGW